jgi:glutaminyl-peptide cyclotransferase
MSQTQPEQNRSERAGQRRTAPALVLILTLLVAAAMVYALVRSRGQTVETPPANPTSPIALVATTSSSPLATAVVAAEPARNTQPMVATVADSPLALPTNEPTLVAEAAAQLAVTTTPGVIPVYTYDVVNVYPHDPNAFTQGLVFDGEMLYEGTGLNGRSSLRRVNLTSGEVLQQVDLEPAYFGEGIVVWGDQIIQLTWQNQLGFIYDKTTFEQLRTFTYPTQGWGITHDGRRLIMSDGSAKLYFWDPETLTPVDAVDVYDLNGPVYQLNELEYIDGEIWANIWQTDRIARIDPVTGQVLGWIDLSGLLTPEERARADGLNGIAYLSEGDRLFVTGKLWPKLFEIRLKPASATG